MTVDQLEQRVSDLEGRIARLEELLSDPASAVEAEQHQPSPAWGRDAS